MYIGGRRTTPFASNFQKTKSLWAVTFEDQRGVGRDGTGALLPVRQLRRDRQLALASNLLHGR